MQRPVGDVAMMAASLLTGFVTTKGFVCPTGIGLVDKDSYYFQQCFSKSPKIKYSMRNISQITICNEGYSVVTATKESNILKYNEWVCLIKES